MRTRRRNPSQVTGLGLPSLLLKWSSYNNIHNLPQDRRQKLLLGKERTSVCPKCTVYFFALSGLYSSTSVLELVQFVWKQSLSPNCRMCPLHYLQCLQPAHLGFLSSFSQPVSLIVFVGFLTIIAEQSYS